MAARSILLVSDLAGVNYQSLWGHNARLVHVESEREAREVVLGQTPVQRFEYVVLQRSLFEDEANKENTFRSFLKLLVRDKPPKTVLIIEDAAYNSDDLPDLSREFTLNILPVHEAISNGATAPQVHISHLLIGENPSGSGEAGNQRQIGLIQSLDSESSHQEGFVDTRIHGTLDYEQHEEQFKNISSESWWRDVHDLGSKLKEAIFGEPGRLPENWVLPVMSSFDAAHRPRPIVAITRGENKCLLPIELVPYEGTAERPFLFHHRPVMHQVTRNTGTMNSVGRPEQNFLMICTSSELRGDMLPGAEYEVLSLKRRLQRHNEDSRSKGKCEVLLSRDYKNFDDFLNDVEQRFSDVEWDVVHWAGHGERDRQSAKFRWSQSGETKDDLTKGKLRWLTQQEMNQFIKLTKPRLLHFSCCHVGSTESVSEFIRGSVQYVLAHRWHIVDDDAPEFAAMFYKQWLIRGLSPSVALFETRRHFPVSPLSASSVLAGGVVRT